MEAASLVIGLVVFEPHTVIEMLTRHSIQIPVTSGVFFEAKGKEESSELLCSVFSDWIDFLFVPEPQTFAIYADHDEYATFYSHTSATIDRLTKSLVGDGFKAVTNYVRSF